MLNAYVGNSIVKMQRIFGYVYPGLFGKDLTATDMAASIAKGLKIRQRTQLPKPLHQDPNHFALRRVKDNNGSAEKRVTDKQKQTHKRSKGSAKQRTCFICKKYQPNYVYSSFVCPRCGTCICQVKRNNRDFSSCLAEHLNTGNEALRCNGVSKCMFPPQHKQY